jgi:AraC-like DNA-binding protein
VQFLFLFVIGQFAFVSLLLLRKRRLPGIRFLVLLLANYAAGLFVGYLYGTQAIFEYPVFARMGFPLIAFTGPLIHLTLRDITEEGFRLHLRDLWIFIIPIAELIYLIPFFFSPTEVKIRYLQEDLRSLHLDCLLLLYAGLLNNAVTAALPWWRLYRDAKAGFGGLFRFAHLFVLALSLVFLFLSVFDKNLLNSGIFAMLMAVLALVLSYFILFGLVDLREIKMIATSAAAKYEKSALTADELTGIAEKIAQVFTEERLFIDHELSLGKLAAHLKESNAVLSQVFSRHFKKSFYEYVTEHRLAEFERLAAREGESILSLAFRSGFSSKATFNAAFKKKHGIPPSQFTRSASVRGTRSG